MGWQIIVLLLFACHLISDMNLCRPHVSHSSPFYSILSFFFTYVYPIHSVNFSLLLSFPYPNLLCRRSPRFAIHHILWHPVSYADNRRIWIRRVWQMFRPGMVLSTSIILTNYCAILTLERGSSIGSIAITLYVSVPLCRFRKLIVALFVNIGGWIWGGSVDNFAGFNGQTFPEPVLLLVVLCRPFVQLFFDERFHCWARDCTFEIC